MRIPIRLVALFVVTVSCFPSLAATLHVPADHPTIQSCIEAAVSGQDECVVAPGTYNELINFLGKAITLRSSHGPEVTFVSSDEAATRQILCDAMEASGILLQGLTVLEREVRNAEGGRLWIRDCSFFDSNIMNREQSSATITRSKFKSSLVRGYRSTMTVIQCSFVNCNEGAIWSSSSLTTIDRCLFYANSHSRGGAIRFDDTEHPHGGFYLSNSVFVGNSASEGGVFSHSENGMNMNRSSFTQNHALVSGSLIWAFKDFTSRWRDSVIWDNGFPLTSGFGYERVNYSNLPPKSFDSYELGIIYADPLFIRAPSPGPDGTWDGIDDDYGDLRLQPGSPCINAGDPDYVPAPGERDLDGHARVLCGRVDMGAYEFGIGDFDCN